MIDRVIVFCSPNDLSLTELCIASIRFWNKNIPVFLHKDQSRGSFDTSHIEKHFSVELCDSSNSSLGNPLSKLYYITRGADLKSKGERILILDSDTVMFGDLVSELAECQGDLAVSGTQDPSKEFTEKKYFSLDFFNQEEVTKTKPTFVFNTGHILLTTGVLSLDEFEHLIIQDEKGTNVKDGIQLWDQGLINYVVNKRIAENSIDVHRHNYFLWSRGQKNFANQKNAPFLIHWAGTTHPLEERMEHWKHVKRYRMYFLRQTGKPIISHVFKRAMIYTVHYLKQIRLVVLGKKQLIRS